MNTIPIEFMAWDEKRNKMLIGDGQGEVCIVAWSGVNEYYRKSKLCFSWYGNFILYYAYRAIHS